MMFFPGQRHYPIFWLVCEAILPTVALLQRVVVRRTPRHGRPQLLSGSGRHVRLLPPDGLKQEEELGGQRHVREVEGQQSDPDLAESVL